MGGYQIRCMTAWEHLTSPTESGEHVALGERDTPTFRRAGVPGGSGHATAADLTTFYIRCSSPLLLNVSASLSPLYGAICDANYTLASVSTNSLACPCLWPGRPPTCIYSDDSWPVACSASFVPAPATVGLAPRIVLG